MILTTVVLMVDGIFVTSIGTDSTVATALFNQMGTFGIPHASWETSQEKRVLAE